MKNVIVTQRVEIKEKINERRDCLDQSWARLLLACGYCAVPLMNVPELVGPLFENIRPCGVIISGGNELRQLGGDTPERDDTEDAMLDYAIAHDIPVLGVCHGLQKIQAYFGGSVCPVDEHVAVRHDVRINRELRNVNSFHNNGILKAAPGLIPEAVCERDGSVEAVRHEHRRVRAIMWHPEREKPFSQSDIDMLVSFFG